MHAQVLCFVFVTTLCFKFVFVFVFCCVQKCTWSFNFVFRLHSSSDSKSTILKPCHAIHDSTRCEIIDSSTGPAGSASLSLVEIISNLILEFLSAPYIAAFAASLASNSVISGSKFIEHIPEFQVNALDFLTNFLIILQLTKFFRLQQHEI